MKQKESKDDLRKDHLYFFKGLFSLTDWINISVLVPKTGSNDFFVVTFLSHCPRTERGYVSSVVLVKQQPVQAHSNFFFSVFFLKDRFSLHQHMFNLVFKN
jgi:hypothetical protein